MTTSSKQKWLIFFCRRTDRRKPSSFCILLQGHEKAVKSSCVKFIYSEKATKFCKIFPLILTVCTVVKNKGNISQNFVAFSDYMIFIMARVWYTNPITNIDLIQESQSNDSSFWPQGQATQ